MESNCKSCQYNFESELKFCPNCGAKIVNYRLTLAKVFSDFFSKFFSWENTFFKTVKNMITKPEMVLNSYVDGARKLYFHPIAFLIVTVTFLVIIFDFFPFDISDSILITTGENVEPNTIDTNRITQEINRIIVSNYKLISLVGIPVYALISYLTFRKYKHNYAEHFVFQFYLNGISTIFFIIVHIATFSLEEYTSISMALNLLFMFIFFNYCFVKLYKLNVLKTVFANLRFLLYAIPLMLIQFIIIGFSIGFYIVNFKPELLK